MPDDRPDDDAGSRAGADSSAATDSTAATSSSDATEGSDDASTPPASSGDDGALRDGDVVVPMEIYKVVTVFSTLFAVVLVVGGMIALDAATQRGMAAREEVHLAWATVGVGSIVFGAAVYAFASRFRATGMGNPKDADDEDSDDGRRVR